MKSKWSFQILVEELINKNKNILILDTCCILDVIRAIKRNNLSTLESAINIINLYKNSQNDFIIVLPSLIPKEWSDNIDTVYTDTENYIKKCDDEHKKLRQSTRLIFQKELDEICFADYKLDIMLKNYSEKLLDIGLVIDDEIQSECYNNAGNRVIKCVPPAKLGKDSYKDCVIFEETLYLGKLLRAKGYERKIVFASSNTKEYCCLDRKIDKKISRDLEEYKIQMAFSLEHGLQESTAQ